MNICGKPQMFYLLNIRLDHIGGILYEENTRFASASFRSHLQRSLLMTTV